jgi:hypothetical protein
LIALIINVHTLGRMYAADLPEIETFRSKPQTARTLDECVCRGRTLIRKTSLLRKIEPIARRSSFANRIIYNPLHLAMTRAPK